MQVTLSIKVQPSKFLVNCPQKSNGDIPSTNTEITTSNEICGGTQKKAKRISSNPLSW